MDKKRERGDNWSQEEKDLFLQIMSQSGAIIENKKTDTNTNNRKSLEWKNVQRKFYELSGKRREVAQLKGAWRRLKIGANILQSNSDIKEKTILVKALVKEKYNLKIKYQKQELCQQELRHKLEIELLMMEKEKKALEIQLLKEKKELV